MLQVRRDLDLALEPLDVDARAELRGQYLDDDLAAERGLSRREDARHAAAAQLTFDLVRAAQLGLEFFAKLHCSPPPVRKRPCAYRHGRKGALS